MTKREEEASLASYGDSGSLHSFEHDHLVCLEFAGAVNSARLKPQS